MTEILYCIICAVIGFLIGRAYQAITSIKGYDMTEDER